MEDSRSAGTVVGSHPQVAWGGPDGPAKGVGVRFGGNELEHLWVVVFWVVLILAAAASGALALLG